MFRKRCHFVLLTGTILAVVYFIRSFMVAELPISKSSKHDVIEGLSNLPAQQVQMQHSNFDDKELPVAPPVEILSVNSSADDTNSLVSTVSKLLPESQNNDKYAGSAQKQHTMQTNLKVQSEGLPTATGRNKSYISYLPHSQDFQDADEVAMPSDSSLMLQKNRLLNQDRLSEKRRRIQEANRIITNEKLRVEQEMNSLIKDLEKGGVVELRKKPAVSQPAPVDPSYWQGLNSTELHSRFPGIILAPDYRLGRRFVASDDPTAAGMQGQPHSVEDMTDGQVEERFYQLITLQHVDCLTVRRMGTFDDGGWDLCTAEPYDLKPGCIVYSFGINYDFTFDDAMATAFDCMVKSFDPSMTIGDHTRSANVHFYKLGIGAKNTVSEKGWNLMTLKSIIDKLHHSKKLIDVIKLDVEYNEWACIRQMVSDSSLDNVKQLIFEMHTPEVETVQRHSSKEDFLDMYWTLSALEQIGFRRYHYHYNPFGLYTSVRTGKMRSCCYELYYINIRFLKS